MSGSREMQPDKSGSFSRSMQQIQQENYKSNKGMTVIVFDLEATCWENKKIDRKQKNEIIEIGAVAVDSCSGEIESEFQSFVKPIINPKLTKFCTKLTSITQQQVDGAQTFPEVCQTWRQWISENAGDNYMLASWGWYDRRQLTSDCKLHGLPIEWLQKHISLKHQYMSIKGLENAALGSLVEIEGLVFNGTLHRGIDDARFITQVFLKFKDQWNYDFSTNQ
eukprot:TRINITY_DN45052_c0_g1_i3.p1 TRINITY_DN45052_c0_g1~~TRINITY_DN45052_c0_g1_i3.p1  ORF type:complete len:251 (-),score=11.07 TRINITY_DN45052_c0_g1_i3:297-962(-)